MSMTSLTGRRAYAVAAAIFIVGVWSSGTLLLRSIREIGGLEKSFVRFLAPGEETFSLPQPGAYTVYFENKSELEGKTYLSSEAAIAGLELVVEDADTGERIPVSLAGTKGTYSIGSREGSSLFGFTIAKPGRYRFIAEVPRHEYTGQPFVLAIGQGFMKNLFGVIGMIFAAVMLLIVSIAIPTVIIVVTHTHRKAAEEKNPAEKKSVPYC